MEPFLGQIQMFGFSFAPIGWARCEGQLLSIASNSALFSLLGTIYGGDGRTTFGLPDFRGRFAMNYGQGPGLSNHLIGHRLGTEAHSLVVAHNHLIQTPASSAEGESGQPGGALHAAGEFPALPYGPTSDTTMAGFSSGSTGSSSVDHMNPYLAVNFCIALQGVFPSRA